MAALEVADIFRRHGEAYRQTHAGHLGRTERRIMGAVEACRTAALGGHIERCADCGLIRVAYNSCRNRHCPKCQGPARAAWVAERQAELLPAPYFHVVFTLPASAAEIAFQNKAAVYAILFKAAAETLTTIAADPRHLGAEIGFIGVLHTWGQNLQHHPHVHCLVPGGGLSLDGTRWVCCRLVALASGEVSFRWRDSLAVEADGADWCRPANDDGQPLTRPRQLMTSLTPRPWICLLRRRDAGDLLPIPRRTPFGRGS